MNLDELKNLTDKVGQLAQIEQQEINLATSNKTLDAMVKLAVSMLEATEKDQLASYVENLLRKRIEDKKAALANEIKDL